MPVGSSVSFSRPAPPWRHALVSGSHLDLKMTENSGSGADRAGKHRELELGSCCLDLDKQVSDEICQTRKRQWGPCAYVIVYGKLPPSPVILWILLGGKPKWLPLNFGFNDVMRTAPI